MKIKKEFFRVITTRFLCPTNRRGSRVKAIDGENSVTIPWNHGLSSQENHFEAVKALCEKHKFKWSENWGMTRGWNQNGFYFFPLEND